VDFATINECDYYWGEDAALNVIMLVLSGRAGRRPHVGLCVYYEDRITLERWMTSTFLAVSSLLISCHSHPSNGIKTSGHLDLSSALCIRLYSIAWPSKHRLEAKACPFWWYHNGMSQVSACVDHRYRDVGLASSDVSVMKIILNIN